MQHLRMKLVVVNPDEIKSSKSVTFLNTKINILPKPGQPDLSELLEYYDGFYFCKQILTSNQPEKINFLGFTIEVFQYRLEKRYPKDEEPARFTNSAYEFIIKDSENNIVMFERNGWLLRSFQSRTRAMYPFIAGGKADWDFAFVTPEITDLSGLIKATTKHELIYYKFGGFEEGIKAFIKISETHISQIN